MDRLYDEIRLRLASGVEPATFERIAIRLLRQLYPSLVPIEGPADAGADGVGADAGGPFFVAVTTANDVRRNLKGSMASRAASDSEIVRVMVATTTMLSGVRQENLATMARDAGFELVRVFDGAAFAEFLYGDADARMELLGISGGVEALSRFPPSARPAIPVARRSRSASRRAPDGSRRPHPRGQARNWKDRSLARTRLRRVGAVRHRRGPGGPRERDPRDSTRASNPR